ncbi:MAG: hypothetical protein AABZ15_14065 [Nitrospirota bacterium]
MKRRTHSDLMLAFVALLLVSAVIGGCGSASKESAGVSTGGTAAIGVTECYNCHGDKKNPASFDIVFGDSGIVDTTVTHTAAGWINGPHGNNESWISFTKQYVSAMNTGFPDYAEFTDATCAGCHDPLNEGKTLSLFFTKTSITLLGIVDRPVIGCEACHGGGGNHFGVGPLPYAKPDADRCGQCHSSAFPDSHLAYHPEGDSIVNDYKASKHAVSINEHTYVTAGDSGVIRAKCTRCHTDEGAKLYVPLTSGTATYGDFAALDSLPNISGASAVQCRTCHDGHNPFILLGEKDAVAPASWSEEFKTCTSCHQLLKATGAINDEAYHTPYSTAGTTINSYGSVEEIIPDTHFDLSTTPTVSSPGITEFVEGTGGIEGYVIVPSASHDGGAGNANTGICRDCHNPHKADNTINRQWAKSAHGGFILNKKENAANAYTAAVLDADAPGWIHYNWKENFGSTGNLGRRACQRCHTSTGFRNFANAQATYDANGDTYPDTLNNFSHLSGGQAELLYCWGCHTDNVGGMRDPGPIAANYNVFISSLLAAQVTYTYPDVGSSNVCMGCHTGRENGESIALLNTQPVATTANFGNLSFINSHYLTAGGTIFTATGYEFTGRDYSNPAAYMHDHIGTAAAPVTGQTSTIGPCAGCHMRTTESHLFLPVAKNETTGAITAVTSTACAQCHGTSMTPAFLEARKTVFAEALEALLRQLDSRGIYFKNAHPYFYLPRYATGTVSLSNGSDTVTGSGTTWTTASIRTGPTNTDTFKVNLDGTYYNVAAVVDDITLTLAKVYTGPTVTNATYVIARSGSSAAQKNWLTSGDTQNDGSVTGKNNMGAAFNYNLLEHDPGAFVHNSAYAKRLIYDAIDWLDDNVINYSAGTTLNGLDAVEHPYKTDAMAYILVNETPTGTSAERP